MEWNRDRTIHFFDNLFDFLFIIIIYLLLLLFIFLFNKHNWKLWSSWVGGRQEKMSLPRLPGGICICIPNIQIRVYFGWP
jgi:hypothetical protein